MCAIIRIRRDQRMKYFTAILYSGIVLPFCNYTMNKKIESARWDSISHDAQKLIMLHIGDDRTFTACALTNQATLLLAADIVNSRQKELNSHLASQKIEVVSAVKKWNKRGNACCFITHDQNIYFLRPKLYSVSVWSLHRTLALTEDQKNYVYRTTFSNRIATIENRTQDSINKILSDL
jgi:hypothetical protein